MFCPFALILSKGANVASGDPGVAVAVGVESGAPVEPQAATIIAQAARAARLAGRRGSLIRRLYEAGCHQGGRNIILPALTGGRECAYSAGKLTIA